jgi:hypothetical protein
MMLDTWTCQITMLDFEILDERLAANYCILDYDWVMYYVTFMLFSYRSLISILFSDFDSVL